MQDGGFQNNPLMRLTILFALLLLFGFWVTNFGMYFANMSLRPDSVVAYYNGSEPDFRPPRSTAAMIETAHMHLPVMGMVLLFLTHLLIFAPGARPAKIAVIVTTFVSALMEEGGGWLVRFVSPGLAWVKPVGFVGMQAAIAVVIAALVLFLVRAAQRQAQERAALARERHAASLGEEGAVHAAME
jgi:hypothetical protein